MYSPWDQYSYLLNYITWAILRLARVEKLLPTNLQSLVGAKFCLTIMHMLLRIADNSVFYMLVDFFAGSNLQVSRFQQTNFKQVWVPLKIFVYHWGFTSNQEAMCDGIMLRTCPLTCWEMYQSCFALSGS